MKPGKLKNLKWKEDTYKVIEKIKVLEKDNHNNSFWFNYYQFEDLGLSYSRIETILNLLVYKGYLIKIGKYYISYALAPIQVSNEKDKYDQKYISGKRRTILNLNRANRHKKTN